MIFVITSKDSSPFSALRPFQLTSTVPRSHNPTPSPSGPAKEKKQSSHSPDPRGREQTQSIAPWTRLFERKPNAETRSNCPKPRPQSNTLEASPDATLQKRQRRLRLSILRHCGPLRHPHETPNVESRSNTLFLNELRWFRLRASPSMRGEGRIVIGDVSRLWSAASGSCRRSLACAEALANMASASACLPWAL